METVNVTIKKPLYDNFVYVRDMHIRRAMREGKKLKITIPQGAGIVDPVDWIKTGKKMEKVFKYPDNPMILWGNRVPLNIK